MRPTRRPTQPSLHTGCGQTLTERTTPRPTAAPPDAGGSGRASERAARMRADSVPALLLVLVAAPQLVGEIAAQLFERRREAAPASESVDGTGGVGGAVAAPVNILVRTL